jgi:small basic protein
MKAWFPIASLAAGFLIGFLVLSRFHWWVPAEYAPYLSVAALVGLDTAFGGIRAGIEGRFQNDIFVSGFLLNTILAGFLVWFGKLIGVDFALVSVLVLGSRIFLNLSLIRRYYLNKQALARSQQRDESAAVMPASNAALNQKPEIGGSI